MPEVADGYLAKEWLESIYSPAVVEAGRLIQPKPGVVSSVKLQ